MSEARYPKPRALAGLGPERHAVIEASAGTGKTYTLEHLVIELLLETSASLDEILVVTFTEKAAAELRLRLRKKLTDIARLDHDAAEPGQDFWRIDARVRKKLTRALVSFDAASISTIHAFCHRMLGENAFDNRRLFKEELVDGRAAFGRAFLTVLRRTLAREDRYAAFLEAWLDENRLDDLVALLFDAHTKRGDVQPKLSLDRLDGVLREVNRLPMTPNALRPALRSAQAAPSQQTAILRRIALLRQMLQRYHTSGRLAGFLAEITRQEDAMMEGLLGYLDDRLSRLIRTRGTLETVRDGVRRLSEVVVPLGSAVVQVFLPLVREELAKQKGQRGQLDFDDMLALLRDGLDGPAGETLLQALRERYRFALIDEFQDTDEVQWEIFRRLFLDQGAAGRLFVIGDPKQAIYGFRGADVQTYLAARAHLIERGGDVVHLTENFRSSAPLIGAVNLLLDQSRPAPFFTGRIRYEHPVTCGRPEQAGLTIDGRATTPVHVVQVRAKRGRLSGSAARRTLADRFAKEIAYLLDPTREVRWHGPNGPQPLEPDQIYVLTRSAKEGMEIGRHLRRAGVPYAFYKQDGLFQTAEADDVRSVLAAIADPSRRSRRIRAWQSPFFSVPLDALASCADLPGSHPFMERLLQWKAVAEAKDYDRLFTNIIEDSRIIERELFLEDSERELTNYLHIFEVLQEEASRSKSTLPELIHTLTAFIERRKLPEGQDGNVQRLESERNAVQIMTMHKAKGLEAPVVFLFGGFDQARSASHIYHQDGERSLWIGPNPPPEVEVEADEEDQRLVYVALTRAMTRLYLPYFGTVAEGATDAEPGPRPEMPTLLGSYRQLNEQLDDVMARRGDAPIDAWFSLEEVTEIPFSRDAPRQAPDAQIERWSPPARLLEPPAPRPDLDRLRRGHLGRIVTSYSRIKAAKGGYTPPEARRMTPNGTDELVQEVDGTTEATQAQDILPGGTSSGRFIHEMLELVPLASVAEAPSWRFWGARPDIKGIFEEGMRRYDRSPVHLLHATELVHTALAAPLRLGALEIAGGVAAADRVVREMEFLFPIPDPGAAVAERGFVKGFIDVVLEHEGRMYVLDWKSDLLPSYEAEDLDAHVAENYQTQAELYTLALVKLLAVRSEADYERRFGGAIYCFVRGMDVTGDGRRGVYHTRPSWAEVVESERALERADLTHNDEGEPA